MIEASWSVTVYLGNIFASDTPQDAMCTFRLQLHFRCLRSMDIEGPTWTFPASLRRVSLNLILHLASDLNSTHRSIAVPISNISTFPGGAHDDLMSLLLLCSNAGVTLGLIKRQLSLPKSNSWRLKAIILLGMCCSGHYESYQA